MQSLVCAFIGTLCFSCLFGVPKRYYLWCGLTGLAAWGFYLIFEAWLKSEAAALFLATALVVLLSRFEAVFFKCPASVFMIAGIFPLVPGASLYTTVSYLVADQLPLAAATGYETIKSAICIVLAIIFVFEIPHSVIAKILFFVKTQK
jgi:uncharacterized membrane protein YjjB (DUF3815 family)